MYMQSIFGKFVYDCVKQFKDTNTASLLKKAEELLNWTSYIK